MEHSVFVTRSGAEGLFREIQESRAQSVRLTWWASDSEVGSGREVRGVLDAVHRVLPEALPVRWGGTEPPDRHLDEPGGLEALAERVHEILVSPIRVTLVTRTVDPCWEFDLGRVRVPAQPPRSSSGMFSLTIRMDAAVLSTETFRLRLSAAFREIAVVTKPFYAEARIEPVIVAGAERYAAPESVTSPRRWAGFPHTVPFAMVVGAAYRDYWTDPGGESMGGMVVYSSDSWPDPPGGGVPVAPTGLLQEFDPRQIMVVRHHSGIQVAITGSHQTIATKFEAATSRPPVWPFPEPEAPEPNWAARDRHSTRRNPAITSYTMAEDGEGLRHALISDGTTSICGINREHLTRRSAFFVLNQPDSCQDCQNAIHTE